MQDKHLSDVPWERKDLFEACMDQARFSFERFDARRNFEWKITLALWALIAAGTKFLYGKMHGLPWYICVIVPVAHAVWLRGIWVANRRDQNLYHYFRDKAADLMAGTGKVPARAPKEVIEDGLGPWTRYGGFLFGPGSWAPAFELLTTILLTLGTYFVLR